MITRATAVVENYPAFDIADLRRAVGGRRKLRLASSVTIHLEDRSVTVQLTRARSSIPGGQLTYVVCPRCQARVRRLRLAPVEEGMICAKCLRREYRIPYASQVLSLDPQIGGRGVEAYGA